MRSRTTTERTHLVILETHVPQERVVLLDARREFLELRLVLVDLVSGDEALVELDDLSEREVLPRRTIQPPRCLNELRNNASVPFSKRNEKTDWKSVV